MTFRSFHDLTHLYFITASVTKWKPLFGRSQYADIIMNSLTWLQKRNRILLFTYVLMPSHFHAIIKPEGATIAEILQQFGSFTAHEILKLLQANNEMDLLRFFHENRRDPRHEHSIWQDIQAKNVYSMYFLRQKMEYIHQNPVSKDWKLVQDRADYIYSTAGHYDYGRETIIEITDVNEWLMENPSPGTAKGA